MDSPEDDALIDPIELFSQLTYTYKLHIIAECGAPDEHECAECAARRMLEMAQASATLD